MPQDDFAAMDPALPAAGFDWGPREWTERLARVAELVVEASTSWSARRPTPALAEAALRDDFRGPAPREGLPFEALSERLRGLIPRSG